jgi:DNA-binding NtrC family response regulator
VPVDVRIIAATQIPLERAVADRKLRPDLRGRLGGYTLRIPPLRERRVDLPSLFRHLLQRHGLTAPRLSPRLVEALCIYGWPLNVRELDFLAGQLAALHAEEPVLRRSHLPEAMRVRTPDPEEPPTAAPTRDQLLEALTRAGGNLARAAETLGISRPRAYRLLGREAPERMKNTRRRLR